MIDASTLSPHAKQEPRQAAYEIKRRIWREAVGMPVKRMERNRE